MLLGLFVLMVLVWLAGRWVRRWNVSYFGVLAWVSKPVFLAEVRQDPRFQDRSDEWLVRSYRVASVLQTAMFLGFVLYIVLLYLN